jgi:hypothetical protein
LTIPDPHPNLVPLKQPFSFARVDTFEAELIRG